MALLFSFNLLEKHHYLLIRSTIENFINKDKSLILIIDFYSYRFCIRGISLYAAKVIMIGISEEFANLQMDMMRSLIKADIDFVEKTWKNHRKSY